MPDFYALCFFDVYSHLAPVVLIIFNRPSETELVFARIREAKPNRLFIVSDGRRAGNTEDEWAVQECRRIVSRVPWDCKVSRIYSSENMGCKERVSTGLSEVFSKVESAIILEDDCVPEPDFFRFVSELLIHYRYDSEVGAICGSNPLAKSQLSESYSFSKFPQVWGWGTWSRVWKTYDASFSDWPQKRSDGFLSRNLDTLAARRYWRAAFDSIHSEKLDTWDYQLVATLWRQQMLSAIPGVNLVSNIGFGPKATHTLNPQSFLADQRTGTVSFPIKHPTSVSIDSEFDLLLEGEIYSSTRTRSAMQWLLGHLPKLLQQKATRAIRRISSRTTSNR